MGNAETNGNGNIGRGGGGDANGGTLIPDLTPDVAGPEVAAADTTTITITSPSPEPTTPQPLPPPPSAVQTPPTSPPMIDEQTNTTGTTTTTDGFPLSPGSESIKKCRFILPDSITPSSRSSTPPPPPPRALSGGSECSTITENYDSYDTYQHHHCTTSSDSDDAEDASVRSLLGRQRGHQRRRRRRSYRKERSKSLLGGCWKEWRSSMGIWPTLLLLVIGGMTLLVSIENAEDGGPEGKGDFFLGVSIPSRLMDAFSKSLSLPSSSSTSPSSPAYALRRWKRAIDDGGGNGNGHFYAPSRLGNREIPLDAQWIYTEPLNPPDANPDRLNLIESRNGAVSSDVEACSKIGVEKLKEGGNAVDAVIATAVCIGTYNSFASGVGGGGFAVVRMANGESRSFNFREMAPAKAHRDMYNADPMLAQRGGLAFAIPGEVDGFWTLHGKYGQLPWESLWEPSIELNRNGFPVTETLATRIDRDKEHFLKHPVEWSFLFSEDTGGLLMEGETMRRPALAKTLEILSKEDGHREFYHGWIAESLAQAAQEAGGIVTKEDFAAFFTVEEGTVKTKAFGREFVTCQAPCSGPVLIEGLNIADGLNVTDPSDPVTIHRMVETMKWLSAGRTELGDPTDTAVENEERVEELMTLEYAAEVRLNISDDTTYPWKHYRPSYEPNEPKGTSHISVLDRYGNAVALTTTVNLYWGNLVHDVRTGIVLNSEMDDFSIPTRPNAYDLRPSIYNYIKPFKRPLSSTTPTISVERDGKPGIIIGASGGSRIVTSVFECIVKSYLWGYDLLDVVKSPRIHHQLLPEVATVERGVSRAVVEGLRERGHVVLEVPQAASVVQAIRRTEEGRIFAVSDWWRKKGRAAGY